MGVHSRSPKTPTLQLIQKCSKSATAGLWTPICSSFGTLGVWEVLEIGCGPRFCRQNSVLSTCHDPTAPRQH